MKTTACMISGLSALAYYGTVCVAAAPTASCITPGACDSPSAVSSSRPATLSMRSHRGVTPQVCADLPQGLSGVMLPNVPYTLAAMYTCAGNSEEMTIWCEQDAQLTTASGGVFTRYNYCCGEQCESVLGMPEEETCKVEGKKYKVGHSYKTKIDGQKVTLWCTDSDNFVTCAGDECASDDPLLTPPGPHTCDDCEVPMTTPFLQRLPPPLAIDPADAFFGREN